MPLRRFFRPTVTCGLTDSVALAARRMRDARVGCVVAVRDGRPVGILTDRDITLRVVAAERNASEATVGDVVTYDPQIVSADDGIETVAATMRAHGVRRLPIVDADGGVVGIVTADDLIVTLGECVAAVCDAIEGAADAPETR